MLYISRRIGRNKFGIVDTDDYTEEVVDKYELAKLIELGIEVKGIKLLETHRRHGQPCYRVSINVYQDAKYASASQAKMHALLGVTVNTSGTDITGISFSRERVADNVNVRLSDYGNKLADSVFFGAAYSSTPVVTLVLDDKIRVTQKALDRAFSTGFRFDIRGVTNKRAANSVYGQWLTCGSASGKLLDWIIDNPERQMYYEGLGVVIRNYEPSKTYVPSAAVNAFVSSYFQEEFENLAKSDFQYKCDKSARLSLSGYMRRTRSEVRDFWNGNELTYERVRALDEETTQTLTAICAISTCNVRSCNRLSMYLKYFTPTPEIKSAYVTLCVRANRWLIELGRSMRYV